ncbi:acyl-CoA dehydrogenase [Azospirillum canadense]|uniref:acyl-CoA dehydrogenase n=1 Tax=Azospirillum canadense TaxID=403962 RepID=UPI002227B05E|nr:acyl-CoA dehydrogenase [Azospirillum canadense]MCW2241806.1 alkylation response protein AidB-like acyl-CoA dehydrogenase [Azospirillum canadense]
MQNNEADALASEVEAFRDSARSFLGRQSGHARIRALRDAAPGFERAVWQQVCDAGWPAVLVPEDRGGLGLGLQHAVGVLEEVGRALLPEPVIGAGVLPVLILADLPPSPAGDELLAAVLAGDTLAGAAWQERDGMGESSGLQTVARRDGDHVVLQGRKSWVVPGPAADGWLVTAAMDGEDTALLWVPADTAGVLCDAQPRIDGSPMGVVTFENAVVEATSLLAAGPTALRALERGVETARLLQAAELLGVARESFDTTLEYLKTRVQFGKPIGANQALQHRMVDAYLQLELAEAGLRQAIADADAPRLLPAAASRAKARCAEAALQITRLAVQFHGAMGYTDECAVGLYLKRAMHLASWLGNAPAHRDRYLRLQQDQLPAATDQPADIPAAGRETDWATMDEGRFRAMVRGFFRTHYPRELRNPPQRLHWPEIRDWYMTLSRQGWLAPSWPREHGGMALPPDKLLAFIEEQEDWGVARMPDQGLINLGPLLITHGTEQQKRQWLPPILSGEHIWCQGYSEPNAGSDLAALRTEAVADGDDFIVNGQKIWTTLAQDATHIFMLVRTGKFAKRQEGISFLLADLSSPGVTVRPIRNIAGEEEFCEVYFDDVRVPQANLVGALHQGWHVAKSLLGHERIFIGSPKTSQYAMGQLRALAEANGVFDDPVFAARFAQLQLDLADLRALYGRFADIVKRGEELPPSVSLLKIWASETYTRIGVALMEVAGDHGGAGATVSFGTRSLNPLAPLMNALVTTIYGGTNEIQRNILSRQVLGLPV